MKIPGNVHISGTPPLLTGGYILHKGVIKVQVFESSLTMENCNIFLIDWLTVTCHGCTVDDIISLLGMSDKNIPWQDLEKYRNGYPRQRFWNGITISYGADDPDYVKDPTKVRTDMGICLNLSGTGCRSFETYGHGNWFSLLFTFFTLNFKTHHCIKERKGKKYSYNITRLDLAFDDHSGILDIYRIKSDVESRYYTSKSKYSEITWSDDQNDDIQGLTVQVGSDKSDIKVRIYDKAAERSFKDRHWVRLEIQLRDVRATAAAADLIDHQNIGFTVSSILNQYLTFRVPSEDSNKSRWPIADYWSKMLLTMESIRLWRSTGEEYNFSSTEHWLIKQYGQAIRVLDIISDDGYLINRCRELYDIDDLSPKYKAVIKNWILLKGGNNGD